MEDLLRALSHVCCVTACTWRAEEKAYRCVFHIEASPIATVTIRLVFQDEDSGADLAITNIFTEPNQEKCHGYGSQCLKTLLQLATEHHFTTIYAIQVWSRDAKRFWERHGFRPVGNETSDYYLDRTLADS